MRPAISTASCATAGGTRAGTVVRCRMPSRCSFSPGSKAATAPSSPRAAITEISRSKVTKPSSTDGAPPTATKPSAAEAPASSRTCPLPS